MEIKKSVLNRTTNYYRNITKAGEYNVTYDIMNKSAMNNINEYLRVYTRFLLVQFSLPHY